MYSIVSEIVIQVMNTLLDPIFIGMVLLIIYNYKKIKQVERPLAIRMGLKDTFRGVFLGQIVSIVLVKMGFEIPFSYSLLILIPIALVAMMMSTKFVCFSYIVPIAYLIHKLLLIGQIDNELFDLPYQELIVLVGILHLIEGLLVYLYGHENYSEIPIYKEQQMIKGYTMNKFWPIPLFIFKMPQQIMLVPVYGILGYGDVAFYKQPKQKSRHMGIMIFVYGLGMIGIGRSVLTGDYMMWLVMLMMPLCHEGLFIINKHYDRKR